MIDENNALPSYEKEIWAFDKLFLLNHWLPVGFDSMFIKYEASIPKMPLIVYSCRLGTEQNSWGVWSWELHFRFFKWEVMLSQLTKWGMESMKYDMFRREHI